ncbi:unnamed protein product [Cylicocyclus nassatus]|uniref:DNA-directed RNA polymerase III subunit RPC6 n=1 Tax=Cylicocyclus nassatus TaxID=53992 RepID=A0AA36GKJ3_CYLNA|nr:unnamed protein product [Cylicocyclus nassatus]
MLAAAPTVKTEVGTVANVAIEDQIYGIVQSSPDGMDTDTITALTPAVPALDRQNAINNLLVTKRLVISKTPGGALKLKVNTNTQLTGATDEEQAIYTLIEDSKRKGIWIRELRDGSGLSQIQLRKVLKSLEQKKLIKNVKAVGTTKKCYMLYGLEPDTSLTGGTFYSDQQLDSELIHTLVNVCIGYVQGRRKQAADNHPDDMQMQKELSSVRPQEIVDFVLEKRVLNVSVTLEDIERILDVAVLDGAIERRPDGKVRSTWSTTRPSPLVTVPCSTCPVVDDCSSGHVISPQTCRRTVGEGTQHEEVKYHADVVGVTLTRVELIFAIGLYVSAMASLLFLFEMIKPSIAGLF